MLAQQQAEKEEAQKQAATKKKKQAQAAKRAREKRNKPGATYKDCSDCPQMVVIPEGSFKMGSNESDNEQPIHTVTIKKFSMSTTEVTFDQWDACHRAKGCSHKPQDEGWGRANNPVINVNWNDANEYAKWISKKTGKKYRLPSEAEWEYAARAGSMTKYPWGNIINCSQARYGYFDDDCGTQESTDPVMSHAANKYGLYDMHGNVWEWTQDCWNESYYGAPNNGSPWLKGACARRVLRGGSWLNKADDLRSACRNWNSASRRFYFLGFRLAQDQK